ncbi:lytic transglycosylase [Serratia marcescens]|uniref:lytic transglycosylase n=2 Tax=Serratia TaxID=613 RepID=UPI000B602B03|nr:lytic transglycosylase [Serratia marcescens]ASL91623.1 lytic transglycosylase [Serratia marcescens]MBI6131476.1 lytic transglycosylase [Serratia marcescens]MBN5304112.1 lytic transglycosylase [Serratia marcescens]
MNAETIKDFLISLGFDIDEAGGRKFESVVSGVTMNAIKMGAAVEAAALTIVGFTTKIASSLDRLYWQSQRTGATANNIRAIGYAFSQAGGSVEGFNGTLDNLARFLRSTPGAEGFLRNLGIQTRDAAGNLRDTAQLVTLVGDKLAKMPYYRANQYAQILGIDESTLLAMRRGVKGFTSDYQSMLQATGFDSQKAAEQSNKFMTQMRGLANLFGIMRDKIGGNLAGGLAGNLESFRKNILLNFPKIEGTITAVLKKVLSLADSIMTLVYRGVQGAGDLMRWWDRLDDTTKGLIKVLGGLLLAWRMLNSAFLTSPIGMVTALIAALVALYDDYQVWKEGGDSLINWGKWKPEIDAAMKGIKELRDSIFSVGQEIAKLLNIDLKSWSLKGDIADLTKQFGEFGKMMTMIGDLINALKDGNWSEVGRLGKALLSQGQGNPDALPAVTDSANSAADWVKDKTGFDPRSVGQWIRGQFSGANEPRGIRNNNPGNLNYVGQNGATLEDHATPRFARFNSAFEGFAALGKQIKAYYNGTSKAAGYQKLQSVEDIISRFAPASENNTQAYINKLSKMLGVGRGDSLNIQDPQVLATLMNGITQIENGKNPYAPEMVLKAAQSAVGAGGSNSSVFNINVQGGGDPRETARLTGDAVEGVYRRQTRNMQTQVG